MFIFHDLVDVFALVGMVRIGKGAWKRTAQYQSLNTGHIGREVVAMDGSVNPNQFPPVRKVPRPGADSHQLQAEVAEALFEVHRLEAIVEDLAVVVARVGRVTVGIGDVEDRLDHLERTFGT